MRQIAVEREMWPQEIEPLLLPPLQSQDKDKEVFADVQIDSSTAWEHQQS